MSRRCKLISPTNLMLEQPMLSPVEETEFILFGLNEHKQFLGRRVKDAFRLGVLLGLSVAGIALGLVCFGVH